MKHSDYVVLRGRTSEQQLIGGDSNDLPVPDEISSNAHNKDIMTGQKQPSMYFV